MTREEFQKLAASTVLLDGATGSNLLKRGMPRGTCSELWILDHKDVIQQLQKEYIEAGSQILCAPTFGGNSLNLRMHCVADQIEEINRTLLQYSKEIAPEGVYVGADISTTGKIMAPNGDMTYEKAFDVYCEQIDILAKAGADLVLCETMINIDEAVASVDAARSVCDLPVYCTMTVEADGSIFSGGTAVEAALALEAAGADAVGINCSVGPDQLVAVVRSLKEAVSLPIIAKPNAGMPFIDDKGNAIYNMTDQEFARHMMALVDAGATFVGGCCGTSPDYIRAMKQMLAVR